MPREAAPRLWLSLSWFSRSSFQGKVLQLRKRSWQSPVCGNNILRSKKNRHWVASGGGAPGLIPPVSLHALLLEEHFRGDGWPSRWSGREPAIGCRVSGPPSVLGWHAHPSAAPHAGLPATPWPPGPTDRCPFPAGPLAVKPLCGRLCVSPCDPSQMAPATISCRCAMTGSSLTCVRVRQEGRPAVRHPAPVPILLFHQPSGLHTPTAVASMRHPPVSPNLPRREVSLCSC